MSRANTPQANRGPSAAVRAPAARRLTNLVSNYIDYWEDTGPLCRREVPCLRSVLIVNLADFIRITDGSGEVLVLEAGDGFVTGIHDRHALSHSSGRQAGVHVWLTGEGAANLLGGASPEMRNRGVKLTDLFGRSAADLGERLLHTTDSESRFSILDDALCGWTGQRRAIRSDMAWAFGQIRRNPARSIADLAAELGWSRQTLSAQFRANFGISPKTAIRLSRFERVIAACEDRRPAWADIAIEAGYFDQSHMIRDFIQFAGLTPAEYAGRLSDDGSLIEIAG